MYFNKALILLFLTASCVSGRRLERMVQQEVIDKTTELSGTGDYSAIFIRSEFCGPCLTAIESRYLPEEEIQQKFIVVTAGELLRHQQVELHRKILDFLQTEDYHLIFITGEKSLNIRKQLNLGYYPQILVRKQSKLKRFYYRD